MGSGAQATVNPSQPDSGHPDDTLLIVGGYTDIDLLAHTPCVKSHDVVTCLGADQSGDQNLNVNLADIAQLKSKLKTGVHVLRLCGRTGSLTHLSTNSIGPNVAFICKSPVNDRLLYASTERIDDEGEIITLRLRSDFTLEQLHRTKAGGRSTCYLNFNKSKQWLMAIHYWDAKISCFDLEKETGRLGDSPRSVLMQEGAKYVDETKPTREEHWQYRQKWPHSHCVVTEPYHGLIHFVVDLGLDRVFAYRVDSTKGTLVQKGSIKLPKGKGPRHLVFHPTQKAAYLVNELDSTVSCFKVNLPSRWVVNLNGPGVEENNETDCEEQGAVLELTANVSSLPECEQGKSVISPQGIWKAKSHSSEIRMHPNGKFFVVGNRGHDSVATFEVTDFTTDKQSEKNSGGISLVNITSSGGECPRNFNWAGNGRYLVVGNQNSSTMCVFGFDAEKGQVSRTPVFSSQVASPNYVFSQPFSDSVFDHGNDATVEDAMLVEDAVETPPRDVEVAVAIPA